MYTSNLFVVAMVALAGYTQAAPLLSRTHKVSPKSSGHTGHVDSSSLAQMKQINVDDLIHSQRFSGDLNKRTMGDDWLGDILEKRTMGDDWLEDILEKRTMGDDWLGDILEKRGLSDDVEDDLNTKRDLGDDPEVDLYEKRGDDPEVDLREKRDLGDDPETDLYEKKRSLGDDYQDDLEETQKRDLGDDPEVDLYEKRGMGKFRDDFIEDVLHRRDEGLII